MLEVQLGYPGGATFRIFNPHRADNGDIVSMDACVEESGLSASTTVWAHYATWFDDLIQYFEDLAQNWRGWSGSKSYSSIENALSLSATHNGTGEVRLEISLKDTRQDGWSLTDIIVTDPGAQMEEAGLLGLQRGDFNLHERTVRIIRSRVFVYDGSSLIKEPKSSAGNRTLSIPSLLIVEIEKHLGNFVGEEVESLVFTGEKGGPLSPGVLQKAWAQARASINRCDLHIHDLRHSGLTIAASTGATTAELMHRAGHSSADAALRYQHATFQRDQVLAGALDCILDRQFTSSAE